MQSRMNGSQSAQGRWQRAMAALARAQAAFAAIERTADASDAAFRRAWMGLWRAERYQLELMRREQHGWAGPERSPIQTIMSRPRQIDAL